MEKYDGGIIRNKITNRCAEIHEYAGLPHGIDAHTFELARYDIDDYPDDVSRLVDYEITYRARQYGFDGQYTSAFLTISPISEIKPRQHKIIKKTDPASLHRFDPWMKGILDAFISLCQNSQVTSNPKRWEFTATYVGWGCDSPCYNIYYFKSPGSVPIVQGEPIIRMSYLLPQAALENFSCYFDSEFTISHSNPLIREFSDECQRLMEQYAYLTANR